MNKKHFYAPSAWRLEGAVRRAATALLLCVMTTMTAWASVPAGYDYIDASGTTKNTAMDGIDENDNPTVLTGSETTLGSSGTTTWYVVSSDISHEGQIYCRGDVHIILCDGKTMTVNGGESYGIYGEDSNGSLTIYGQTLGTGTLDASSTGFAAIKNDTGNMVINGGTVTATGTTYGIMSNVTINGGTVNATGGSTCICAYNFAIINGGTVNATGGAGGIQVINMNSNITISGGTVNADGSEIGIKATNITISGGTVNAIGGIYGIDASWGTITLGWTNATDYIHASSYAGTVQVADGQTLLTDDNPSVQVSGTVGDLSLIDGKTLWPDLAITPASYMLADGTTLEHDGCTVLNGSETTLEAGVWYYLSHDIHYDHSLTLGNGEVTLILGNGATMSFPQANIAALYGENNANSSLTIYGQTLDDSQAGKLVCTSVHTGIHVRKTYTQHSGTVELSGNHSTLLYAGTGNVADGSIIVNGGKLKVDYVGSADYAIHATESITFNGGKMEVTTTNGSKAAVQCSYWTSGNNVAGDITLGWTNTDDYIRATSYYGNVTLAKDFVDEDGTLHTPDNVGSIAGKTLRAAAPVAVTLGQGVTATSGFTTEGGQTYAIVGTTVTVSVAAAPEGYTSTVTFTPEGGEATAATDLGSGSWSFTVPAANVTVSTALSSTGQPVSVSYMRADGSTATAQAVALDGTETELGEWGKEKWYFVGADISHDATINLYGSTTIILKNGCTMNIGEDADGKRINGTGINGVGSYPLTIYGQSLDDATAGNLKVFTTGNSNFGISYSPYTQHSGNVTVKATGWKAIQSYGDITVNGGTLSVTSLADDAVFADDGGSIIINGGKVNATSSTNKALWSFRGNVTINGGQVEAIGTTGIYASQGGTITLGWTNASDFIRASSYYASGTVQVADGLAFLTDDATPQQVSGTISDLSLINGKKLSPDTSTEFAETGTNEYTIKTAYGWGMFCDALLDNTTYGGFSGKTVRLANDISVSRCAGNGTSESSAMNENPFCGTFLGQGHTLTFNYGSADAPSTDDYIAPFRYVSGATISGLHVSGNIYTSHVHAGGIIGLTYGTTTVSDCRSSVNIVSSINGDGTHGGLIACTWSGSTTNIEGCLFDGSIQSATNYATDWCGGFIGWRNNVVNVTNCLLTADLSTIGVGGNSYPSCTFVRNGVSSITNSYYTQALGTEQGKQLRSIKAGANISTNGYGVESERITIDHAGVATEYDVSGITAYKASAGSNTFMAGILYDDVLYAGAEDAVSLMLGNTPPEGYAFDSYTASPAGATITGDANPYTLTMPNADVLVKARFAPLPITVSYIDENGETKTVNDAIDLSLFDGEEIPAGSVCSFSSEDIAGALLIAGDVTIIIPDDFEISVFNIDGYHTVTFYGQEKGNGKFNVSENVNGNVTVHGGNVYIEGFIRNNVYLSGANLSCSFWAANIAGSVTIAEGKTFYDGDGNTYTDEIPGSGVRGKTLRPYDYRLPLSDGADNSAAIAAHANGLVYNVTISGRTLYMDGDWNTLCLPFDLTLSGTTLEGAEARKLTKASISGTTLNLTFSDPVATLEAGVPYIIKWNDQGGFNINSPWFPEVTISAEPHHYDSDDETDPNYTTEERVRFIGTYDRKTIDTEDRSILFLGAANTLYYPSGQSTTTIGAFRAYFKIGDDDTNNARQLTAFNFTFADASEQTGIVSVSKESRSQGVSPAWYTLDGRKLDGKPTKKGLYIVNGKKVVVK